jgi:hypothetical protein
MAASGTMLDATQEMITLGLCNLVGSFLRSMPISGSFTRSAVNNASGVRTPFGGLYTGTQSLRLQFAALHHATEKVDSVTLLIYIREVPIRISAWTPTITPLEEFRNRNFKYTTTVYFHIVSNSQFNNHPSIRRNII